MSFDPQTPRDWIDRLAEFDHAFVTEEFARDICEVFAVQPFVQTRAVDEPGTFKGFSAWDEDGNDLPAGTEVRGADADFLAVHLVHTLGLKAGLHTDRLGQIEGRGTRLRAACDILKRGLEDGTITA